MHWKAYVVFMLDEEITACLYFSIAVCDLSFSICLMDVSFVKL